MCHWPDCAAVLVELPGAAGSPAPAPPAGRSALAAPAQHEGHGVLQHDWADLGRDNLGFGGDESLADLAGLPVALLLGHLHRADHWNVLALAVNCSVTSIARSTFTQDLEKYQSALSTFYVLL